MIPAGADPPRVENFLYDTAGALAFDIGGNTGRVAAQLAERFDRVVAFEPCVESFGLLAAVNLPNVTAVPVAVSDHDGEVLLDEQEHPIRSGQLTTGGYVGWGRVIGQRRVPCRSLDSLVAEYGVPDLVKIDVEAHELCVVRGGLRTLIEHTPQLYIEVHAAELGEEIRDLLALAYDDRLGDVRHPNYRPGDWGADNHYWLIGR